MEFGLSEGTREPWDGWEQGRSRVSPGAVRRQTGVGKTEAGGKAGAVH